MEPQQSTSGTQETENPDSPRLPEPDVSNGANDKTDIDQTERERLVQPEINDAKDPANGTDKITPHADKQNRQDDTPSEIPKQSVDKRSVVQMFKKNWRVILCVSAPVTVLALLVFVGFGIVMYWDTVLRKPTDGAWSHWGNWEVCSVTCAKGIHHRSRNCSNTVPSHGGRYCAGPPWNIKCVEYNLVPVDL